jgi:hypothetical protein
MHSIRLGLVAGALALAACRDSGGPVSETRYVLRSFEGASVPVSLYARPEASATLLADTIYLRSNGTSRWVTYTRLMLPLLDPPVDRVDIDERRWRHYVRGDSLFFSFRCPSDVPSDCLWPPTGEFSSDRATLTFRINLIEYISASEYRRVDE